MYRTVLCDRNYLENRKLPADSPLQTGALFIDEEGLLRIGVRLQISGKRYEEKHPVLPKTHYLSMLVVQGYQLQVLHSGARDTPIQVGEALDCGRTAVDKEGHQTVHHLSAIPLKTSRKGDTATTKATSGGGVTFQNHQN